jgi:hypothetical protein
LAGAIEEALAGQRRVAASRKSEKILLVRVMKSFLWYEMSRQDMNITKSIHALDGDKKKDFLFRSRIISDTTNLSSWEYTQRRIYMTAFSTGMSARYFLTPRFSYDVSGSVQYESGTKRAWAGVPFSYGSELRQWYFSFGTDLTYSVF